jgi:hypothetical protein
LRLLPLPLLLLLLLLLRGARGRLLLLLLRGAFERLQLWRGELLLLLLALPHVAWEVELHEGRQAAALALAACTCSFSCACACVSRCTSCMLLLLSRLSCTPAATVLFGCVRQLLGRPRSRGLLLGLLGCGCGGQPHLLLLLVLLLNGSKGHLTLASERLSARGTSKGRAAGPCWRCSACRQQQQRSGCAHGCCMGPTRHASMRQAKRARAQSACDRCCCRARRCTGVLCRGAAAAAGGLLIAFCHASGDHQGGYRAIRPGGFH